MISTRLFRELIIILTEKITLMLNQTSTKTGQPISPNNLIRRCLMQEWDELGLPHVSWLTFRRTYSSWSHDKGIPSKVTAQLMGHTNVDVTLNVYTQVMDDSLRISAERVGRELFSIVQSGEGKAP